MRGAAAISPPRPAFALEALREAPPRFIALGATAFTILALALVRWGPALVAPGGRELPIAFGLTHVAALGFVTAVIFGVVYQLHPLLFGRPVSSARVARLVWWAFSISLACFVLALALPRTGLAAVAGVALALAVVSFTGQTLARALRATITSPARPFLIAALGCLAVVAALGTTLGLNLDLSFLPDANADAVLAAKVELAVAGWVGLTMVGMSYHLVPVVDGALVRPRHRRPVLVLMGVSAVLLAVALGLRVPPVLRALLELPYFAAGLLYAVDVFRLVRSRSSARLGPTAVGQVLGSLVLVAGAAAGAPAVAGIDPFPQVAVTTALLGVAPILIASNAAGVELISSRLLQKDAAAPLTDHYTSRRLGFLHISVLFLAWSSLEAGFLSGAGAFAVASGALFLLGAVLLPLLVSKTANGTWLPPFSALPSRLPGHRVPDGAGRQTALRIQGLVAQPLYVPRAEFAALPHAELEVDFSCEEGWSVPGLRWRGVPLLTLIGITEPLPDARFVRVGSGVYEVSLDLDAAGTALLCDGIDGRPLARRHGAPWRLVVPGAGCFTSVKWVDRLELTAEAGQPTGEEIARARLRP